MIECGNGRPHIVVNRHPPFWPATYTIILLSSSTFWNTYICTSALFSLGHGTSLIHIIIHMHTSACICTLMDTHACICMQMHVHYSTQTDSACTCIHMHTTEDPLDAFHPYACMSVHVHADGFIWMHLDANALGMHPIMCFNKDYCRISIDPRLPSAAAAQPASLQLGSPSVWQQKHSQPPFSPSEGH